MTVTNALAYGGKELIVFTAVINFIIKLECLSLQVTSTLVQLKKSLL